MSVKIAINGFGRIGRLAYRLVHDNPTFEVVAINDLSNPQELAHLLKYDTTQGRYMSDKISVEGDYLVVDGRKIRIYAEKDASQLPWGELNVDVVLECTGFYASKEKSMAHITAGAKKVIINSPAKGDLKTIVFGVNHETLDGSETVISGASCTTNCLAPVAKVLDDSFGIVKGYVTTVHSYTNDQVTLDRPHPKGVNSRRGRTAASNIIPTSTGAASAVGLVLPQLKGKLDGIALRVPTATGSVVDLTVELSKNVTVQELNDALKAAANETLGYTEDPIVSSDTIGMTYGSLVDGQLTQLIEVDGKQLVKVIAWYDNEMSYTAQLIRTAEYLVKKSIK
jgi:glyceraldehyde 3-phosphate dehydrogenase